MKSVEFLDQIKTAYSLDTDYKLGKLLGWTHTRISNYRKGRSRFDDATCEQVATMLHIDPLHVLAVVNAERTTSIKARTSWLRLAKETKGKTAKVAASVTLAAFLNAAAITGYAPPVHAQSKPLYIMLISRLNRRL